MISNYNLGDIFKEHFLVSEKAVKNFISVSNDKNPLHIDDKFAKKKGFKSRVIHGNLQNCFISFFIGERLPSKGVIILSQSIQYKKPVYINDNLYLTLKIVGLYESVSLIEFDIKFNDKKGELVSNGKIKIKLI